MGKAKDPAFLFYPGDWLGGTMIFSRQVKGAYMDLLMGQFNNGHMAPHMVLQILGKTDYDLYWETMLKPKFKEDENGCFFNERLETEILKRRNFVESRRKNLPHMEPHMRPHMENENDIGIGIDNEKVKYLEFVFLKKEEYEKLKAKFSDLDQRIQNLNDYIGSTGRKYKSHYHTILTWDHMDQKREKPVKAKANLPVPDITDYRKGMK